MPCVLRVALGTSFGRNEVVLSDCSSQSIQETHRVMNPAISLRGPISQFFTCCLPQHHSVVCLLHDDVLCFPLAHLPASLMLHQDTPAVAVHGHRIYSIEHAELSASVSGKCQVSQTCRIVPSDRESDKWLRDYYLLLVLVLILLSTCRDCLERACVSDGKSASSSGPHNFLRDAVVVGSAGG